MRIFKSLFRIIGKFFSKIAPFFHFLSIAWLYIYSGYKQLCFNNVREGGVLVAPYCKKITGGEIGANCTFGKGLWLASITKYKNQRFESTIKIGNNCKFGDYNHISAIDSIEIGDGVLTGQYVLIQDHSHGSTTMDNKNLNDIKPANRPLYSKGKIIIGNNVWLCDRVVVLGDVTIGHGSIIGANSVVTHDIPAGVVAAGCPAKVIKTLI